MFVAAQRLFRRRVAAICGLDDLCWASPFDNNRDGGFEVLWDAR